jgi:hypothetical protein
LIQLDKAAMISKIEAYQEIGVGVLAINLNTFLRKGDVSPSQKVTTKPVLERV